ncbi:MAG TPA: hypothetical protein VI197_31965 [Polyangiaceae bacterium]
MGTGTLRISYLALISALFIACGKDESGGSDDDDDTSTVTTNTATSSPSTSSPNTSSPNTTSTTGATTTTGSPGGSGGTGGSDASGGSGGTMNVGGSAGDQGSVGGSAGAPGGSGGGGTVVIEDDCGYEACGGDLADTDWRYSRLCVEEEALLAPFQTFCDSIGVVSAGGEVSGTISFTDDSFTQDVTFSVNGEFDVPEACIVGNCAVVGLGLAAAGLTDASCVDGSNGGCLCSGTMLGESTASGDYSSDGDNVELDGEQSSYCVSGDSLKYTGEIQGVEFVYETLSQ